MARRSLGRQFGWLWTAYAVSAYGSGLGFGAFPLIAVLVLHASPAQVSALSAVGPAVGALIALPLGPWVEFRRKRPAMIAMDLARFAVMMTVPIAYALGRLSFAQLLVVSAVVARPRSPSMRPAAPTSGPSSGQMTCSWLTRGSSPRPGAPSQSDRR